MESSTIIYISIIKPPCLYFFQIVLQTFWKCRIIFKCNDKTGSFRIFLHADQCSYLPYKGVIPAGWFRKYFFGQTTFFFCGDRECIVAITLAADSLVITIFFFFSKSVIDELKSKIG